MKLKWSMVIGLIVLAIVMPALAYDYLLVWLEQSASVLDQVAVTNYIATLTSDTQPEGLDEHPIWQKKIDTNITAWVFCMDFGTATTSDVVAWATSNMAVPAKLWTTTAQSPTTPQAALDAAGWEPTTGGGGMP